NWYHPARFASSGISISPSSRTPTGSTAMSIPTSGTTSRTGGGVGASWAAPRAASTTGTEGTGDVGTGVGSGVDAADGDAATTGPGEEPGPVHAVSRLSVAPRTTTAASTRAETRERADALPGRDVIIIGTVSSAGWRRDGRARHRSDRR